MPVSRRQFLAATAAVPFARPLAAIDPLTRPGPVADLKLSLAAYSFNKQLDLKKPAMTLFDFIDLAAALPVEAVELTSYYFAETTDAYLDRLKAHAAAKKLAISGVPVRSNFCLRDAAKRRADIDQVTAWCGRAGRVGAKTVRVFAGTAEAGDAAADAVRRVVATVEACLPAATAAGVALAMENHGGVTATADGLLAIVTAVKGEGFGVNIDTGNFKTADPYADVAKVVPYGVVCQVKTEVFPAGVRQEADLGRMVAILKAGNFHGYVALEYEAAADPHTAVPQYVKQLRTLIDAT